MTLSHQNIHNRFKLNGVAYTREEIREVGHNLVKEGEAFEKDIGDFLLDWCDDKDSIMVQTSGSTGTPKSIWLKKQHMVNSARATGQFFGLQPGDSALLCLPATYIAGKMMLVRAMVLGLEIDCSPPASNPLQDNPQRYDFCAMVPLQLENALDEIERISTLIVGGAPLSQGLYRSVQEKSKFQKRKTEIFETYGMTETITHIALKRITAGPVNSFGEMAGKTEAQISKPERVASVVPFSEMRKAGFKTLPKVTVSTDDRGCLVIEAPLINDAPVITNDIVELISDTEFRWLGRYDNVVNSGGVKLYPEQIESKLTGIIASRFFVVGVPDQKLGQKLVLVVEWKEKRVREDEMVRESNETGKAGTEGKAETQAKAKSHAKAGTEGIAGGLETVTAKENLLQEIKSLKILDRFEVPKEIFYVPQFQHTRSGKIRRKATLALAL
ncbi:AMP-binding protein [Pricia sp. S334]|uniref:AMP-binding protein n=1 Tax=Pricia mediterranea TaxID=3076079 RepID=A0ABU3L9A3_9FLAO|nr:AMP-binding protein [Pricia sp. S334]MDT7830148.1 AMP-binding protein [Pricia sp. S334]